MKEVYWVSIATVTTASKTEVLGVKNSKEMTLVGVNGTCEYLTLFCGLTCAIAASEVCFLQKKTTKKNPLWNEWPHLHIEN